MTDKSPLPEVMTASPTSQDAGAVTKQPSSSDQGAGILPASHWEPIEQVVDDDADSTYSSEFGSTASIRSSIRAYRTLHGRTYHRDIGQAESWEPNDENHAEAMDMAHHLALLTLGDDKLHLAPLKEESLHQVLDIGTGTGIWAIDFADRHPNAHVTGTDVSPIQPSWVPPNVRFEIDDANLNWTWKDNTFDFIHVRMLLGNIISWRKLFAEAFRCCKPGGWVESHEASFRWRSDVQEVPEDSPMGQMSKVFWEGGKKFGRTFRVVDDDLQQKYMEEAGFVDIVVKDYTTPFGDWPQDKRLKQIGMWAKAALLSDLEGYILYIWNAVMGWSKEETQLFLAHLRVQMKTSRDVYWIRRVVYGRKPE
ncbi:hypothetical protein VTI74DRAFT_3422 [Chaetomium olivicolor]